MTCCGGKCGKCLFVSAVALAVLLALLGFSLTVGGAVRTFRVDPQRAAAQNLTAPLAPFFDCSDVAVPEGASDEFRHFLRHRACVHQSPTLYLMGISATIFFLSAVAAVWAALSRTPAKVTAGSMLTAAAAALLLATIYAMFSAVAPALADLAYCRGMSVAERAAVEAEGAVCVFFDETSEGEDHLSEGAKWLGALGVFYGGVSLSLVGAFLQWLLLTCTARRIHDPAFMDANAAHAGAQPLLSAAAPQYYGPPASAPPAAPAHDTGYGGKSVAV